MHNCHAAALTLLLKFHRNFRRNNGANEGNISSLLDYCRMQPIEDKVNTAKPGGGLI